jgi:hypothetical protein
MNNLSELGEKLYISSSQEGRDFIRGQVIIKVVLSKVGHLAHVH